MGLWYIFLQNFIKYSLSNIKFQFPKTKIDIINSGSCFNYILKPVFDLMFQPPFPVQNLLCHIAIQLPVILFSQAGRILSAIDV